MELNDDLVAVQGLLISVIRTCGEFTKINYKGGNEEKILDIMVEIQKFLSAKNYLKDGKINSTYKKQLQDIVFFLAINTNFKKTVEQEEYCHLINIMPQLSKCLLVNIVYGLDLCECYCNVIEKLPVSYSVELLEETIPCLKKSVPKVHLEYAYMFLKAAANKLSTTDYCEKVQDDIEDISEVTNIILQNLTGLYADQTKHFKIVQIYQHMGYTLLYLFELLLYCSEENLSLKIFIKNVLRTCCSVIKNVTINVFCSWAEIDEDDQPLQRTISEKAYFVVEKYQKYKDAEELISMLSTIAKKPKTLAERIQEADITTIIKKINKKDQFQKNWFQALLNTSIFSHIEAVQCISNYAHLCDENDVTRLINLSIQSNNADASLALKCASTLNLEKLILVTTRHFYENQFRNILNEDVHSQLMLIFNKLNENTNIEDYFVREITLLLLQNPKVVLTYIYNECLKNTFYTACLRDTFSNIREIAKIENIGVDVLKDVMLKNMPNSKNIGNYIALFRTTLEINYFSNSEVLLKILNPISEKCYKEKYFKEVNYVLQILMGSEIKIPVKEENRTVIEVLLYIMVGCRCTFLEFDSIKHQNARLVVDIMNIFCEVNPNWIFKVQSLDTDDDFTVYYKKYLSSEMKSSFFKSICPEFNIDNYTGCISELLQVLPRSVTYEWLSISKEIFDKCGSEKTIVLLTDVMILLCEMVNSQSHSANEQIFVALKYCIQQFGIIIQQKFQVQSTIDMEVNVTKNICRLLRYVPDSLKEEEGLSLVNLLTERSLKLLANEKEFVGLIYIINNNHICKTLAQKIIS